MGDGGPVTGAAARYGRGRRCARGGREGGLLGRAGGVGGVGTQDRRVSGARRAVGLTEGGVGFGVRTYVGFDEGSKLGCALGAAVGVYEGLLIGTAEGDGVGAPVGTYL